MGLKHCIEQQWYGKLSWLWLLLPLHTLFVVISTLRANRLKKNAQPKSVPIIVVGNIVVGGTGKTPLIIALVKHFKALGYSPGVVSRGYGGTAGQVTLVDSDSSATICGDEPLLIAKSAACPVAISKRRNEAVELLIDKQACDLIFSDDGLQHYSLHRDIELVVIDAARGLGNGWRMPLGPLREPPERLQRVDFVLINNNTSANIDTNITTKTNIPTKTNITTKTNTDNKTQAENKSGTQICNFSKLLESVYTVPFYLKANSWVNVATGKCLSLTQFNNELSNDVVENIAVCAIGNPQRFFDSVAQLGIKFESREFDDHHQFTRGDFLDMERHRVLMTEKDAVKCKEFAQANWWALSVDIDISQTFIDSLEKKIHAKRAGNIKYSRNAQNEDSQL